MNKRHYEHTLPNIRGSLSNTYITTINDKTVMVEYCVYWLENGEPMHEVFSNLAAAEMYSCAIRGKENVEWVEVSEEEAIDLDELEDMFPDDFCGV